MIFAYKWNDWYEDICWHDDYIEVEDIIFEESCIKYKIDVSASNLKLVNPTSPRLIELTHTQYLYTIPTQPFCDHFFDAPKFLILGSVIHIDFANNFD